MKSSPDQHPGPDTRHPWPFRLLSLWPLWPCPASVVPLARESSNCQEVELKEAHQVVLDALGWDVRKLWMQVPVGPVERVHLPMVPMVQVLRPDPEPPPEPLELTDSVEVAPRISSQSPWHWHPQAMQPPPL